MTSTGLEVLLDWMAGGAWRSPPDDAHLRAISVPRAIEMVPTVSARARQFHPSDVRAASTMIDEDRRLVGQSWEHIDVSLLVETHHDRMGMISIEGRVWLEQVRDPEQVIDIVWTHEDHVIDHRRVGDGQSFRLEAVAMRGWALEIHVTGEPTVLLEDPDA